MKTNSSLRLLCCVDDWKPSASHWHEVLHTCVETPDDIQRILRYHKGARSAVNYPHHENSDPKCFLCARLLLQNAARNVFGQEAYAESRCWKRTKENKPYLGFKTGSTDGNQSGPHWNINASHAGGVVAVAAEPHRIVGVDVMPVTMVPEGTELTRENLDEFFEMFNTYFTVAEWRWLRSRPHEAISTTEQETSSPPKLWEFIELKRFMILWTLKESYIKAVGIGMGFELQRASFSFSRADVWCSSFYEPNDHQLLADQRSSRPPVCIHLDIDGKRVTTDENESCGSKHPCAHWSFSLSEYKPWNVVVASAVGPLEDALHAGHVGTSGVEQAPPNTPQQCFSTVKMEDVVAESMKFVLS